MFSPLCDVIIDITKQTDHYRSRNGERIDKITIHHMAGNLSAETCGRVFLTREASANYGIGSDGRIGGYVPEEYGGWSTANPANDRRAINIELANDGGAESDWHVSDTAIERCIQLCVDVCKRNGIPYLVYDGTTNGTLTRHNMFMATTCPGPYLQSKFPYICEEINKRLGAEQPKENDIFEVNDADGLWLLDDNGNHIQAYPIGTQVAYLGAGYYKFGYNYFKVRVLADGNVGYMASAFLTKIETPTPEPEPEPEPTPEPDPMPTPEPTYKDEYLIEKTGKYSIKIKQGETLCIIPNKETKYTLELKDGDIVRVK